MELTFTLECVSTVEALIGLADLSNRKLIEFIRNFYHRISEVHEMLMQYVLHAIQEIYYKVCGKCDLHNLIF